MGTKDSTSGYAWFLLGFLTLLNVVNFVDRQLITSLQVWIKRDLSLSDRQIGLLIGYVFVIFYTLVGVLLGTVADRWSRPRLIAVGLALWSLLTAATGLAQNFAQMAAARVFVGVGEATLTPAAIAMLCSVFPPRWHARAAGIYYLGIPVGAGLSLMISGALGSNLGWQNCFFLLGGVGLALVGVVWFLPDPPREVAGPAAAAGVSTRAIFGTVLHTLTHTRALPLTLAGAVALLFAVGASGFDVSWLKHDRGFSDGQAPFFLGVVALLGGSAGNVLGGWSGDVCARRWVAGRLLFLAGAQVVLAPAALALRFVPADTILFPVTCFFWTMSHTFFYGSVFSTVQGLVAGHVRSTALALLIFAVNFLGYSPGLLAAAELSKHLGYTWGLFWVGSVGLLSVPLFLLAARYYPADLARVRGEVEGEVAPTTTPTITFSRDPAGERGRGEARSPAGSRLNNGDAEK